MVRKIMLFGLLISVFVVSCRTPSAYKKIGSEYLDNCDSITKGDIYDSLFFYNRQYIVRMQHSQMFRLPKIYGYALGELYGHYFEFDHYGNPYFYKYITDGFHYRYGIFLKENDSIFYERGTPVVDFMYEKASGNTDSTGLVCLLSDFPRESVKAFISTDRINFESVLCQKSLLMPFLSEIKLKLPANVRKIYFKIEATELAYDFPGLQDKKVFMDSTDVQ